MEFYLRNDDLFESNIALRCEVKAHAKIINEFKSGERYLKLQRDHRRVIEGYIREIKKCLWHINSPCPLIHEGVDFCAMLFHNNPMNVLQKIFTDHYEEILYTLHPRDAVIENVEKMINCGDPSYGGAMYGCPKCGKLKFIPFRCHSRFCPTCGNKYSMERTTSMSFKLIYATHRHCVFTIDENLRHFFLEDRTLLNCIFHAVTSVISRMFFKINMSKNFTPGFIMVLHTFGRDLKWNPHIHCLISEGGYSDDGFWRNVKHFNYTFLRNAFRTALLNEMEAKIGPSFKKVKTACYNNHKYGFYVYAKPNKCDPKVVTKYIGRYLGRLSSLLPTLINMTVTLSLSTKTAMKMMPMWKKPSRSWIS